MSTMSKRSGEEIVAEDTKKAFTADTTNGNEVHAVADSAKEADAKTEQAAQTKPTLYHVLHYCSTRPLVVIHELGVADKIDVKHLNDADIKKDDYLAINPLGTIPAFRTESGSVLIESGAIALHILEKYGGADHPLMGKPEQRSKLNQWLFFATSTLYPQISVAFSETADNATKEKIKEKLTTTHFPFLVEQLGSKPYLLGEDYTMADIFMGYELWGFSYLGWFEKFPVLDSYVKRLMERPSWNAANGKNNVTA